MVDLPARTEEMKNDHYDHLVLPFTHEKCDDASITGGKGSSLGKLSKFANISVPRGFCLTTKFFVQFLDEELKNSLEQLEKDALRHNLDQKKLETSCKFVQQKIMRYVFEENNILKLLILINTRELSYKSFL